MDKRWQGQLSMIFIVVFLAQAPCTGNRFFAFLGGGFAFGSLLASCFL